jgi:hypothetical protein
MAQSASAAVWKVFSGTLDGSGMCLQAALHRFIWIVCCWVAAAGGFCSTLAAAERPDNRELIRTVAVEQPRFDLEVRAALTKAACNSGACHGNQNGKGGLRLSLRGEDPQSDYEALVKHDHGRRINRFAPDRSLLLQKPAGGLAHQGGVRMPADSSLYAIVRNWIADPLLGESSNEPGPRVERLVVEPARCQVPPGVDGIQLRVVADLDDGQRLDVTTLAVYEAADVRLHITPGGWVERSALGPQAIVVRFLDVQQAIHIDFLDRDESASDVWPASAMAETMVDVFIFERLRELRVGPAKRCDDSTFARRAYLDLTGRIPTAEQAKAFVEENSPDKRGQLIDQLLSGDAFASWWAVKLADLWRCDEKVLDPRGVQQYFAWIRQGIARGVPIDQMATELLTAEGSSYEHPPANFYRALRTPQQRAEAVARVFMGYRLQCAECHNHPFDRWTQADYFSWAGVFSGIDYEVQEGERQDKRDKNELVGEQKIRLGAAESLMHPRTGDPLEPRLLGERGDGVISTEADRFRQLATWLTSPENRDFHRFQVNWIWYHLLGRGLVEPVDDVRLTNAPTHPELLEALVDGWLEQSLDMRWLLRTVMLSHTYQQDYQPLDPTAAWPVVYTHQPVRRLAAESLLDSQTRVLGVAPGFRDHPGGAWATQLPLGALEPRRQKEAGDRFLASFGKPLRSTACECERTQNLSLGQVLQLMHAPDLVTRLADARAAPAHLAGQVETDTARRVTQLYWIALSRAPAADELQLALEHLDSGGPVVEAWQDLTWALLNSQEFILRF